MNRTKGCFITLEGVDGAGKSTHIPWLLQTLHDHGVPVVSTREPGGTQLGEALRNLVLHQSMHLETETLLMFAARCEHLRTVIQPALEQGYWVVCDRFTDATYAYQGGGRELGARAISTLEQWVHPDCQPDRTWLFDVPLDVARARLASAREPDRFERENKDFFLRTQSAYHARVESDPERFLVVDASQTIIEIRKELEKDVLQLIARHGVESAGSAPGLAR